MTLKPDTMVIDYLEAMHVNSQKLAIAAIRWGNRTGKTPIEVIEYVLSSVLGNELMDDDLSENIIVGMAIAFEVPIKNMQLITNTCLGNDNEH